MTDDIIQATGDLFPRVDGVASSKGVAMNPPPASVLGDVAKMVRDAMANIPDNERGELVGIATRDADGTVNVNLALATKVGSHVDIVAFIGKSWGRPIAAAPLTLGAATRIHF